jgi:hypothetical protein
MTTSNPTRNYSYREICSLRGSTYLLHITDLADLSTFERNALTELMVQTYMSGGIEPSEIERRFREKLALTQTEEDE